MYKKAFFVGLSPLSKIIFLTCIVLISTLVFLIIGSLLAIFSFKINIFSNPGVLTDLDNSNALSAFKLLQGFQHIGLFIVPPIVFAFLVSTNPGNYLRIKQLPVMFSLFAACIIMVTAMPLVNWMIEINETLRLPEFLSEIEQWMKDTEENAAKITEAFLNMKTTGDLLLNMLIIALLPAVGEELLFRGVIQRLFAEWTKNVHLGVIIAAVLFSTLHMQFYGFLPRMMLGILFGYLLVWSKSLWLPILCHFINNGAAVFFYYLSSKGIITFDSDTFGTGEGETVFPLASAVIIAGLLFLLYRNEKRLEGTTEIQPLSS
ncbi:MAG: CPBP family intramembrane glutamic endopeptidase [Bacteroidota bacterium]